MNDAPSYNDLLDECSELVRISLSEEAGSNDYKLLQSARFHAAVDFLRNAPHRLDEITLQDKQAVEITLKACAVYLATEKNITDEANKVIVKHMLNYEIQKDSAGSGARFKQNLINFQLIFIIYGFKKKYGLSATKGDHTSTRYSACDIVAKACVENKLERPLSYDSVRRIWLNRHRYFPGYSSDEQMFEALLNDLPTYVESIALADYK